MQRGLRETQGLTELSTVIAHHKPRDPRGRRKTEERLDRLEEDIRVPRQN